MSVRAMHVRDPKLSQRSSWWGVLASSAIGALGLLPSSAGGADPLALATWLALVAPALGLLAGARRSRALFFLPPALWILVLLAAGARTGGSSLPRPELAGLAVAALYAFGAFLGALRSGPAFAEAALALLATGLFAALPTGGGRFARPWPPPVAARWLDLSPVGFVLESGGVDWMRTPEIYDAVDSASIGPELRQPWSVGRSAPWMLCLASAGVLAVWALRPASGASGRGA